MPLSEPVPDIRSLDLLRSVASEGSIRRAAASHGISQPAASMRLRALEATLGVVLLDRSRGRATLTQSGVAVVEWGEEVLNAVQSLVVGATAIRNRSRSRLRILSSMTVAEYLIPTWLHRFHTLEATTAVSLVMGNSEMVIGGLERNEADLGFIEGHSVPRALRSQVVLEDALVVVVPPGHPWARRRRPLSAQELGSSPLVVREEGSGTREVLEEALRRHKVAMDSLVERPSTTAIKAAVSAGSGPGVLSRLAVQTDVAEGRLVEVPCVDIALERSIRAVWPSNREPSAAAKRFLRVIDDRDGAS